MQLSTSELELGIGMIKTLDRPEDGELRVLMFTATYFVLDGVTLTIRRPNPICGCGSTGARGDYSAGGCGA